MVIDLAHAAHACATIELAGQPDSVAVAPSGRYAAIVIENERDEDENDGLLPQPPGGLAAGRSTSAAGRTGGALRIGRPRPGSPTSRPTTPSRSTSTSTGDDQAVVSLQENNHLVLVDLRRARVTADFSAGTVDVDRRRHLEEDARPAGRRASSPSTARSTDRRREPDTVQWIDDDTFATANEGDYVDADGRRGRQPQLHDLRHDGPGRVRVGQLVRARDRARRPLPRGRSENKGNEPEGLEVGRIDGRTYLFVASERANVVGVYDVSGTHAGVPAAAADRRSDPRGCTSSDGVLAVTSEIDGADEGFLARPIITLFELATRRPDVPVPARAPTRTGCRSRGSRCPVWPATPTTADTVWAVSDSVLAQAYLYRIDVSGSPATITVSASPVGGVDVADQQTGDYDLEGVAARPEGGFWLASEGRTNAGSSRPEPDRARRRRRCRARRRAAAGRARPAGATSSGLRGRRRHRHERRR